MEPWRHRIAGVMIAAMATAAGGYVPAPAWGQKGCLQFVSEDLVPEGGTPTYKAQIKNGCGYVAKDVRVRLIIRDRQGQIFFVKDYPLNPSVLGYDQVGEYAIPLNDLPQKPGRFESLLFHKR